MAKKKESKGKVKVTLERPHRHAGKDYKPGESIEVTVAQAIRLEKYGVIRKRGE